MYGSHLCNVQNKYIVVYFVETNLQMVDYGKVGIGVGILAGTIAIIYLLYYLMKCSKLRCFSNHNHLFQLILTLMFGIGVIISVYEAFGYEMAASLLTGIGLALGLALQPMMQKLVAGMVFDSTIKKGASVKCGDFEGKVRSVGVIHSIIETKEGRLCIHNDYFNKNPVTIISNASDTTEGLDPDQEILLKYW